MRHLRTLQRFKKNLEFGQSAGMPRQFKVPELPAKPEKIDRPRDRLLPMKQDALPFYSYDQGQMEHIQKMPKFWDPLYDAKRVKDGVDPNEEPFCSVYEEQSAERGAEFTKVKNITTPELWAYVERLARVKVAPRPTGKGPLPSGYVPPPAQPPDLPYFVARTRNHLLPLYYQLGRDEESSYTYVRYITGDIWKFEEDLRTHLESLSNSQRRILSSVREPDLSVAYRGKHLTAIADWLHAQGF